MEDKKITALRLKDPKGRGILDPNDLRGFKNIYINTLQQSALKDTDCFKENSSIILDFGCGAGRFSEWTSQNALRVIGLEVDPKLLSIAREIHSYPNVNYILYKGRGMPFKDESIDVILCVGVLTKRALVESLVKEVIAEFLRVLKFNGKVLVINKVYRKDNIGYYKRGELIDFFENGGFVCLRNYPIRKGHWWMLYLITYGLIPQKFIPRIANYELKFRKRKRQAFFDYNDFLFEFEKK